MSGAGSEQPGAFVGGKWQAGEGAAFQSINPATGEVSWSGKTASKAQVEAAIAAARAAYETWSRRPFDERAGILQAYADIVRSRSEEIAGAISADMGKTMKEARQEAGAKPRKSALTTTVWTRSFVNGGTRPMRTCPHPDLGVARMSSTSTRSFAVSTKKSAFLRACVAFVSCSGVMSRSLCRFL